MGHIPFFRGYDPEMNNKFGSCPPEIADSEKFGYVFPEHIGF